MNVTILSSGSSGNATLIEHNDITILLDCGMSFKKLKQKFIEANRDINEVNYVFISHEHIDHVRGLSQIIKHLDVKIYMSNGTLNVLKDSLGDLNKIELISHLGQLTFDDLMIGALSLSHDAVEPMLFVFKHESAKFWFFHDSGYMPSKYFNILKNPSLMVMESNYDIEMLLESTKYPYKTKMRIHSDYGHLSNDQAYTYIDELIGTNTKEVIIAHVSENNNKIDLIEELYKEIEIKYNVKISISEQRKIMETRSL